MITEADIDQLLYDRHLTPEGARILRTKLQAKAPLDAEKLQEVIEKLRPSIPLERITEPLPEPFQIPPFVTGGRDCLFEQFQRANPQHTGPLGLSCPCPRCTPQCLTSYAGTSEFQALAGVRAEA